MHVVINVDDLGLNPAVRRAVQRLADLGAVTSTTILANGPFVEDALRLSGRENLGLGVHLNLLRGRPLSDPADIPDLVDDDGLLLGSYRKLALRHFFGRLDPAQALVEWTAQVAYIKDMGLSPTHLDSEKHIHAWPALFDVACQVARHFNIPWVRRPVEQSGLRPDKAGLRVGLLNLWGRFHPLTSPPAWADTCFGIADQNTDLTPHRLAAFLRRYQPGVLEVVVHPGFPEPGDPPLPSEFGSLRVGDQWKNEYETLAAPAFLQTLTDQGYRTAHYGQLNPVSRQRKGHKAS